MRRVVKENKWRVSLVTAQGQTIEKIVDAPDMASAVRRGQQAFQGQQFVTSTATQLDPGLNVPSSGSNSASQAALPMQMAGMQQLTPLATPQQILQAKMSQQQQRESYTINPAQLSYPYSITLPKKFSKILAETAPVRVNESVGQHTVCLENSRAMAAFLSNLMQNPDRDAVRVIVKGIRSSIT